MKKLLLILVIFLGACKSSTTVPEGPYTIDNWKVAKELREEERYELAYQYYSIALSSANDVETICQLKKEMEDLQRVIKSIR